MAIDDVDEPGADEEGRTPDDDQGTEADDGETASGGQVEGATDDDVGASDEEAEQPPSGDSDEPGSGANDPNDAQDADPADGPAESTDSEQEGRERLDDPADAEDSEEDEQLTGDAEDSEHLQDSNTTAGRNIDAGNQPSSEIDGAAASVEDSAGDGSQADIRMDADGEDQTEVTVDADDLARHITAAAHVGKEVEDDAAELIEGSAPVVKDEYTWAHFKWEYYYDDVGEPPRDSDGEVVPFDPSEYLGFDPEALSGRLSRGQSRADELDAIVDTRTVNIQPDLDEDAFFSTVEGHTTISNRYDLEKTVPLEKKRHFIEEERYWVNKPYAYVVIFHSQKENEKKYYLVEPYLNEVEEDLQEFLTGKLRTAIKYAEDGIVIEGSDEERREVIERETDRLLKRYNLYDGPEPVDEGMLEGLARSMGLGNGNGSSGRLGRLLKSRGWFEVGEASGPRQIQGLSVRPEPVILEEDEPDLSEYQVEKLRYALTRDFIGYERIDGIKHDINVEDISCDGYESPVFVYHTDYEQLITNVTHGTDQLDDFVVKMAQRAGKGISKRQPQVDATLPDGSRAQLTLGEEVSDHGTNYTIRQFKDVPFTPVDLINWKTFSLEEMAFLWLCIENNKSLLFAGGTASGKTTSLNAVSLFIPSNAKIVSIEDTREVELPQRNWVASVTRPSFGEDETGDIDEFDLLEAALRQRPDYIIMGEVRGEEGRTLFQVMSTGHTTYTTFHADNVSEVIKRFTTDPINVSKTLFTALDLVSIQASTRVQGKKVRRSRNITEIRRYDPENDEINVNDVFQWRPETDTYRSTAESTTLDEIKFDRGWTDAELDRKLFERRVILAYLIKHGLNTYTEVAATIQAYINDPDTILTLVANDELQGALEDLREMESVLIDVDPEKESMVPRPDPDEDELENANEILTEAEEELFPEYKGEDAPDISKVLTGVAAEDVVVSESAQSRDGPAIPAAESGPADTGAEALEASDGTGDRPADAMGHEGVGADAGGLEPEDSIATPGAAGDDDDTDDDESDRSLEEGLEDETGFIAASLDDEDEEDPRE